MSLKWQSVLSLSFILYTGIISAIAFSPAHTGMLATGSYSQTSAIYREDNMELLYVLHGQEGGITHVSKHSYTYTWFWSLSVNNDERILFFPGSVLKRWKLSLYRRSEGISIFLFLCRLYIVSLNSLLLFHFPTFGLGRRDWSWE